MTSSGADIEPRTGAFAQTAPYMGREMHVRDVRTDGRDGTRENYGTAKRGDSRAARGTACRASPRPGAGGGSALTADKARRGTATVTSPDLGPYVMS